MSSLSRGILEITGLALVLAVAQPGALWAQAPGCACPPPCAPASCCAPCGRPPDICTCTTFKPVCNTCYHPEPIVGYHNVCRTCYRNEQYCVAVPVTKVNCVTADEGCYKMVWCPKIVTRQVPHTEIHQQLCTRTVPYTVSERVPHVTTQMVPEYRVRYVPETRTFIKPPCCCPPPSCAAPACAAPACGAPVAPGCGCAGPLTSQEQPGGFDPRLLASMQSGQPPQGFVAADPTTLAPVPQTNAVGPINAVTPPGMVPVPTVTAPVESTTELTPAGTNSYARARSAANVWQASRGPAFAAQ